MAILHALLERLVFADDKAALDLRAGSDLLDFFRYFLALFLLNGPECVDDL